MIYHQHYIHVVFSVKLSLGSLGRCGGWSCCHILPAAVICLGRKTP
jgi:hypothetical protein